MSEEPARCPGCQQIITSRKYDHCTTCGALLPKELILTDEQKAALAELEKRDDARQHESMKIISAIKPQGHPYGSDPSL